MAAKYGIKYSLSECKLHLPAGNAYTGDLQGFLDLGIPMESINRTKNICMLKSPLVGDAAFHRSFCDTKGHEIETTLNAIAALPKAHVALHLLRHCASFCKVVHLVRTTPKDYIEPLLERFDGLQRSTLERIVGLSLSDQQWTQAQFPILPNSKLEVAEAGAGLGLRSSLQHADAAYVSSRRVTRTDCAALYNNCTWDRGSASIDEHLVTSLQRLRLEIPSNYTLGIENPDCRVPQQIVSALLDTHRWRSHMQESAAADRARLLAYSAPWSDGWLRATPSETLDTQLSNAALRDIVGQRLGVDVFTRSSHCPFCRSVLDNRGHHCHGCMAGGDAVVRHNEVRNTVHYEAAKACMNPELEKNGLLSELGWPEMVGRRPADTLLVAPRGLHTTSRRRFPKVALDFAVVSPFCPSVLRASSATQLAAAAAYAERKRGHNNTQQACELAGFGFEPIVFETTGGLDSEGELVLRSVLKESARAQGKPVAAVLERAKIRISIDMQRAVHRALQRRRDKDNELDVDPHSVASRIIEAAELQPAAMD